MHSLTKHELRKIYREKRMNLPVELFQSLNNQLMAQVKTLDIGTFSTLHLFLPIKGNHEPDTYAIAEWLKLEYPQLQLILSKTEHGTYDMRHFIWNAATILKLNRWGIPEPVGGIAITPQEIDAIFVPLLAFDTRGNRVGYGKGFYDRFLSECRPTAVKIGLSLFEAERLISDTDTYDVALDACITPTQIWNF